MSLRKRGKIWYCHFFVDGIEFRKALGTTDRREAKDLEKRLICDAKQGKLQAPTEFSRMRLSDAIEVWTRDRAPRLARNSIRIEKERAVRIGEHLGAIRVDKLTPEAVLAYLRERSESGTSPGTLNRELDVFRGVLKRARRWHLFDQDVKPFRIHQKVGKALSYDQKVKLLALAQTRSEWQMLQGAIILALNTTARSAELKALRWRDVDLIERTLVIRKSKTEAGERVVPLNAAAYQAVLKLRERAMLISGNEPQHFVFFACEHENFDPTKPQKSWRTAWRRLTRMIACLSCGTLQNPGKACISLDCKADIEKIKSPLIGLRFHDLRHHAITELAESQASDQTIMSIAGHVSQKMLQHYSHIRMHAKRQALDALDQRQPRAGYSTNYSTESESKLSEVPQVLDFMVELSGIEPLTSSLRTRRSPS